MAWQGIYSLPKKQKGTKGKRNPRFCHLKAVRGEVTPRAGPQRPGATLLMSRLLVMAGSNASLEKQTYLWKASALFIGATFVNTNAVRPAKHNELNQRFPNCGSQANFGWVSKHQEQPY